HTTMEKITSIQQWQTLSQSERDFINAVSNSFYNESDETYSAQRDYERGYFVFAYATHPSEAVLKIKLTARSLEIFKDAAEDAGNWSGTPCLGGNFNFTKEDRGNLTQLKRAKLLSTFRDNGEEWIQFTQLAHEFAALHGIRITA
ncbi:MAG: hypothetical protein WAM53_01605, partial [Terrimicrobiaceae bacterium]